MPTLDTYGRGEAVVLLDVMDLAELARGLAPRSISVVSDSMPEETSLTLGGDEGKYGLFSPSRASKYKGSQLRAGSGR